jgi:Domain of unknown function (DUF4386)
VRGSTRPAPGVIARLIALLYLLESAASVAGQLIIPGGLVVRGDAAATATNILANEALFRVGIAGALLAVALHIVTGMLFYYLLKPVGRTLSLLAVLLLVVASGIQASAALMQSGALVALKGTVSLSAFNVEQLQAIALMLINWNGQTYNFYLVFFGLWCIALGALILRSTFLPPLLGVGMVLAGVGYTPFLYPPLANSLYPYNLALGIGELALVLWLFVRGVDTHRWNEQARI